MMFVDTPLGYLDKLPLRALNRKNKRARLSRKGKPGCHILRTITREGREHMLHATKGWRTRRA